MGPHKRRIIPDTYVSNLELNKLSGRLVYIPHVRKKREILFVYGHHASLERMYPFMECLRDYGSITAPDLPGFGGMDSVYHIDEEASIDTLADYLAAVVKLRFKSRPITIVGFSLGFLVATRMLQKYPDITKQTELLISIAGFTTHEDFKIPSARKAIYKYGAALFSGRLSSRIFRETLLRPTVIKLGYKYTPNAKVKLSGYSPQQVHDMLRFEVELWRSNDVRTHMRTTTAMLTADITRWSVPATVYHVAMPNDQYLDASSVKKHLLTVYKSVKTFNATSQAHMPTVYLDNMDASSVFPAGLCRVLARSPRRKR